MKALILCLTTAALTVAALPGQAELVRLETSERDRVLPLADRLVTEVTRLEQNATTSGPSYRNRTLSTSAAEVQDQAVAFRAALRRGRRVDIEAEVTAMRNGLTQIQGSMRGRRPGDTATREAVRAALSTLDTLEQEAGRLGAGKVDARFDAGRYANVDDMAQLALALEDRAVRMEQRARQTGRETPAVTHFAEQARAFSAAARRETWRAVDRRPQVERLQADLNATLREIRRTGADSLTTDWEWCDGLLDRMRVVGAAAASASSGAEAPGELLGLAHDLQVRMARAEELARGQAAELTAFARLGDQAYAFHHEMHDGRLSYADSRNRVANIVADFRRADQELSGRRIPADLRAEWQAVRTIVEKMQAVTGV